MVSGNFIQDTHSPEMYACMVYESARPARPSYLQVLELIQNQAFRICLNAFSSSPEESLHVEAKEQLLHILRIKLFLQYATKLYNNRPNPTHGNSFNSKVRDGFFANEKTIPFLEIRVAEHIKESKIKLENVAKYKMSNIPPLKLSKPVVLKQLRANLKGKTGPLKH